MENNINQRFVEMGMMVLHQESLKETLTIYTKQDCCFDHTVKRELFMNRKVEQIFKKYNIETGNISIVNQLIKIQRKTYKIKYPQFQNIVVFMKQLEILDLELIYSKDLELQQIPIFLIGALMILEENRKSYNGNSWDLNNTQYRERTDVQYLKRMIIIIIEYLIGKKRKITLALHKIQQETQFYKIQRIGYEIEKIKRIFIDNDINWEYFRDYSKLYYHSYAHLDNFVVIQNGSSILAPVNFDLAYCKEEIINIDFDFDTQISNSQTYQENKNYGKFDLEQWLFYQDQERIGLELAIGGMDMILAIHIFQEKQKTNIEEFFEILLRDQMRIGYLEGMQLKEDSSLFYQRMDQIQVIIKEALNMTQDIIS